MPKTLPTIKELASRISFRKEELDLRWKKSVNQYGNFYRAMGKELTQQTKDYDMLMSILFGNNWGNNPIILEMLSDISKILSKQFTAKQLEEVENWGRSYGGKIL